MVTMIRLLVTVIFSMVVIRLGQSANGPAAYIMAASIPSPNNKAAPPTLSSPSSPSSSSSSSSASRERQQSQRELHVDTNSVDGATPPSDGDVSPAQLADLVERIIAERLHRQPSASSSSDHRDDSVDADASVDDAAHNAHNDRTVPPPPTDHTARNGNHRPDARDVPMDDSIPEPSPDWIARLGQNSEVVTALLMQRLNRLMMEAACLIGVAIIFWFQSQSQRRLTTDYSQRYQSIMSWIDHRIAVIFPTSAAGAPDAAIPPPPTTRVNEESKFVGSNSSTSDSSTAVPVVTPAPIQVQPRTSATASSGNGCLRRAMPTSAFLLLIIYILLVTLVITLMRSVLFILPISQFQWLLMAMIVVLVITVIILDDVYGSSRPAWLQWCHYWLATGLVYVLLAPLVSVLLYVCLIILMVVEALTRSAGVLVVIGMTLRTILPSAVWLQIYEVFWSMWHTAALLALALAVINFFRLSSIKTPTTPMTVSQ